MPLGVVELGIIVMLVGGIVIVVGPIELEDTIEEEEEPPPPPETDAAVVADCTVSLQIASR